MDFLFCSFQLGGRKGLATLSERSIRRWDSVVGRPKNSEPLELEGRLSSILYIEQLLSSTCPDIHGLKVFFLFRRGQNEIPTAKGAFPAYPTLLPWLGMARKEALLALLKGKNWRRATETTKKLLEEDPPHGAWFL